LNTHVKSKNIAKSFAKYNLPMMWHGRWWQAMRTLARVYGINFPPQDLVGGDIPYDHIILVAYLQQQEKERSKSWSMRKKRSTGDDKRHGGGGGALDPTTVVADGDGHLTLYGRKQ
jgi:hypothetical protein